MSQSSEFLSSMNGTISKLPGSYLTREGRESTASLFADFCARERLTHMRTVGDIHGCHFRRFIQQRLAAGLEKRTLQKNASHLRAMLKEAKCYGVANAPELSNRNLGIGGASRKGTNSPMSEEDYIRLRAHALKLGRPGIAAILRLEHCFGLRGNEGLHARLDVLDRWLREIQARGSVGIYEGTKGGRPRDVPVPDKVEAVNAILEAIEIARKQNGFLLVRANGKAAGGLDAARRIYHSWANRAGFKPH